MAFYDNITATPINMDADDNINSFVNTNASCGATATTYETMIINYPSSEHCDRFDEIYPIELDKVEKELEAMYKLYKIVGQNERKRLEKMILEKVELYWNLIHLDFDYMEGYGRGKKATICVNYFADTGKIYPEYYRKFYDYERMIQDEVPNCSNCDGDHHCKIRLYVKSEDNENFCYGCSGSLQKAKWILALPK